MKQPEVTYGQLDKVLRALGFSSQLVQGQPPARHYRHAASGALLSIPPCPGDKPVLEHHFVAARVLLDEFGIADPAVFAAKLQKAG